MAVSDSSKGDGLNLPESTGAVEYQPPQDPPGIDPEKAGESTGAVKYEGPVGGKKVSNPDAENGGQAEVRVEPPKGPVTMTTSWLSDAQAKVITKEHQQAAAASVNPKTSAVAETPEDDTKAEQKREQAAKSDDPAAVERPGGDDKPAGEPSGPNKDEVTATAGTETPQETPAKKTTNGGRRAAKNVGEASKDD
jgi:hypothetical protein